MSNSTQDFSRRAVLFPSPLVKPTAVKRDWLLLFLLALLFMLPLWPGYAELKFGGLPNLAPVRLVRIVLIVSFIWMIFNDRRRNKIFFRRISENWVLVSTLIAFYGLRVASAFVGHDISFQLFAFFKNDVFTNLPIFFIALAAIDDNKSVSKVFNVLIGAGLIASLLAMVDFYLERNIFMGIISVSNDYLMGIFIDKSRDNAYRAQGTFEHPILLGQYFTFMLPLIWVKFMATTRVGVRLYYTVAAIMAVASIYVSGSRAALGIAVIFLMFIFIWEIIFWIRTSHNRVAQYFVISQFAWLIFGVIFGITMLKNIAGGNSAETISSTNSRLIMWTGGLPKVFDSPLIGHGLGDATSIFSLVGRGGMRTLDNFYLLLGLESGVLAPLLFLVFLALSSPPLFQYFFREPGDIARPLIACMFVFIGYSFFMAIHALPEQFWLILLISGIVIVLLENNSHSNYLTKKIVLKN